MPPPHKGRESLGESIYSGAAAFGVFTSFIGMIVALVCGVGLIIWGIFVFQKKNETSAQTQARVTDVACQNDASRVCDILISYVVQEQTYQHHLQLPSIYFVGEEMPVFYNPANPHQVSGAAPNYKVGGGAMMAFGLVIAALGLLQFYIVRRFKFAAAASGLGDAFRLL